MFKMNFPAKNKHTHMQAPYQTSISHPQQKSPKKIFPKFKKKHFL